MFACVSTGAHDDGDTLQTIAKLKHEVRLLILLLQRKTVRLLIMNVSLSLFALIGCDT